VWSFEERKILDKLNSPRKTQDYLDFIPYDVKGVTCSARSVMKEKKADCFSGAIFGAAALQNLGFGPKLVELLAVNDDGHTLAVFKANSCWGAVAKSNFTTLRYREPVYKTIRELVMSYFDFYFNTAGQKTLRAFSEPLSLERFGKEWMFSNMSKQIGAVFDRIARHKILTPAKKNMLTKVDPLLLKAGLLGSNPKGLFKPKKKPIS